MGSGLSIRQILKNGYTPEQHLLQMRQKKNRELLENNTCKDNLPDQLRKLGEEIEELTSQSYFHYALFSQLLAQILYSDENFLFRDFVKCLNRGKTFSYWFCIDVESWWNEDEIACYLSKYAEKHGIEIDNDFFNFIKHSVAYIYAMSGWDVKIYSGRNRVALDILDQMQKKRLYSYFGEVYGLEPSNT